jgi:hypothetical protein
MSEITDENAELVSLYLAKCFNVLFQHIDEIANLAFSFACCFLCCPKLFGESLTCAMPILMHCIEDPLLEKAVKSVLLDAFTQFVLSLETSREAQETFVDISQLFPSPVLSLVAAAFLVDSLPFISINQTYSQILDSPATKDDLTRVFGLFVPMTKTAPRPLGAAILAVASELVTKHEDQIKRESLIPLCNFEMDRIAALPRTFSFVQFIARIDPSIVMEKSDDHFSDLSLAEVRNSWANWRRGRRHLRRQQQNGKGFLICRE